MPFLPARIVPILGAFLLAVAAQTVHAQTAEAVQIGDEVYHGTRTVPGYDLTGTYLYEGGEPSVTLNADGTGTFANHQEAGIPIRWWVRADAAGVALAQTGPGGQMHTLVVQFQAAQYATLRGQQVEREPAGAFDMMSLGISYDPRQMIILGERIKPY